jgi:hypothetical protein
MCFRERDTRQRAYDHGRIENKKMEDARGGSACFYGLDNLPIFQFVQLLRREENRKKGYWKTEEAFDGSLSMLMTTDES